MSNLSKLEFEALKHTGQNYMCWKTNVMTHLRSMDLTNTIKPDNTMSDKEKAIVMILLRKHFDDCLQNEYIDQEDPSVVWKSITSRFDNKRAVMLPNALDEWKSLRFQDFKSVDEYNSALFKIVSQLKFCEHAVTDNEMIEKTLSTFHPSSVILSNQHRLMKYEHYSDLSRVLLQEENANRLLMKNHESRPTGSLAFPEANAITPRDSGYYNSHWHGQNQGRGRGRGRGHGRGYGRDRGDHNRGGRGGRGNRGGRGGYGGRGGKQFHGHNHGYTPYGQMTHPQKKYKMIKNDAPETSQKNAENVCFRCGIEGHYAKVCRTAKHLCDLYAASKGKGKEVNFNEHIDHMEDNDQTQLNASDFTSEFVEF